jgi:NAD-dependent dihydropyrimidine dehydrogenase PreA subunit
LNNLKYRQAKKGRLMIEILPDKCDFCGCCVGVCPEDAIELKEAVIFIIDPRCTNCAKCVWSCPIEVIKFNKEGVLSLSGIDYQGTSVL